VYDADTCTVLVDCGFNIFLKERVRLMGIDTPEIRTKNLKEKELGIEARDWVRGMILDKEVECKFYKEGKFGRYLVDIYYKGECLNELLVAKGYAKRYDGGKRVPWEIS
jgi:micrococcal nuclease